ncbi:DUF2273 domain-containing protein [Kitasatospora sp. NPDC096147]|uniref:DUF2273 domain-containing protein n=1 Tax=Kitasatospora sp. NPDC096147 TaxID=3364093 RepID=UPI0037FF602B
MSHTLTGLLAGLALGFAAAFGGFAAFLLVAVLGALGYLLGRWADGGPGPAELWHRTGRR